MFAAPEIILYDIIGIPVRIDNLILISARFDFSAQNEGRTEHHLKKFDLDTDRLRILFNCFDLSVEMIIQCWLRARIPAAFAIRPATAGDRYQYNVFEFCFFAVIDLGPIANMRAIPFVCVEGYDGPGLVFPKTVIDVTTKQRVAEAFWATLFKSPDHIASYEEWLNDDESRLQKIYCSRGQLCICDLNDWEEGELRYDPHLAPFPGEMFQCPDCDGNGVEDLFPFTEDCATCNGTGLVPWCKGFAIPSSSAYAGT